MMPNKAFGANPCAPDTVWHVPKLTVFEFELLTFDFELPTLEFERSTFEFKNERTDQNGGASI